jgi:hypothetical protein
MGVYSTQLYKLLPQYARFLDDRGMLKHVCEAVQPEIDQLYSIVRNQARYYDPQLTDDRFLDFLQQFVGGAVQDGKWLGIGLNPDWPGYYKREVIPELWNYWQIKGTERGVRQAINLWLQLEQAKTSKVYIRLPLSKFPTEAPNSWFAWGDSYDSHLFQDYEDRLFFGAGDAPGVEHQPDYSTVRNITWAWEWGDIVADGGENISAIAPSTAKLAQWDSPRKASTPEPYPVEFGIGWSDRTLQSFLAPLINDESSHLGARRPWQHLFLNEFDWNKVFPNILDLNPEIYPALAVPTTFGWLEDIRHIKPLILIENKGAPQYRISTEIEIDGMQYGVLDAVGKKPGSIAGSSLYEPAPPSYAKNYPNYSPIYEAGDWWPFPVQDPYYTTEYEETIAEFGVWIPDYWDGMWWASAIAPREQGLLIPEINLPFFGFSDLSEEDYLSALVIPQDAPPSTSDYQPGMVVDDAASEQGFSPAGVTFQEQQLLYEFAEVNEGDAYPLENYQPALVVPQDASPSISDYQSGVVLTVDGIASESEQEFSPASVIFQEQQILYEFAEVNEGDAYPVENYQPGLVKDLVISNDVYTLPSINVWSIDLSDFQIADSLNRPPGEEWYLAWGAYIDRKTVEVFHPGSGCNLGIEIELDTHEIPSIDLGDYREGVNQLLSNSPPQLEPPIKIAEYVSPLDAGWEYYRQPDSDLGVVYKNVPPPIDISEIDMDIELDVPVIDREQVYLCNVFKRWTTGEILKWEEYREEIPQSDRNLFEIYPLLAQASVLENWQAVVETTNEIYLLKPTTAFWRNTETIRGEEEYFLSEQLGRKFYGKTRSQSFSFEDEMTNLHLEFVFRPKRGEMVRSLTLWLNDQQVHSQFFYDSLNFPVEACYGFKFFLPFTLPTGATNPDDNLAILDILPGLRDRLVKLQQLIPAQFVTQELQEEIETVYDQPVTVEGLRTTMTQVQKTLDKLLTSPRLGDLHHVEVIKSPTLQVVVRHGLGKEPAVTFTPDDGFDAEIEVYRPLDANTVRVTFTRPAQGRLFFN